MVRYKNNPEFKDYIMRVSKLMPDLSSTEIDLLKQYFKLNISPEDAVNTMLNFDNDIQSEHKRIGVKLKITDIKKHVSDFDFEEDNN